MNAKFNYLVLCSTLLVACGDKETDIIDADGDGVSAENDCNDNDASMPNKDARS